MENVIVLENVCLTIKKHEILKNITHSFEKGKIHGLIGRNGSGKTMLMKCICGFIKATEGEIIVRDKKLGKTAISLKISELSLKHLLLSLITQV